MSAFFFIQYFIIRGKSTFYAVYLGLLWIYLFTAMPEFFFHADNNDAGLFNKFTLFKRPLQYLSGIFYTLFVIYYLNLERSKGKGQRDIQDAHLCLWICQPGLFYL